MKIKTFYFYMENLTRKNQREECSQIDEEVNAFLESVDAISVTISTSRGNRTDGGTMYITVAYRDKE